MWHFSPHIGHFVFSRSISALSPEAARVRYDHCEAGARSIFKWQFSETRAAQTTPTPGDDESERSVQPALYVQPVDVSH